MLNVQPKFGGKIIDIVSGDIQTPEQKSEALNAVKNTILEIFLIVVVGYSLQLLANIHFLSFHAANDNLQFNYR